MSFSLSFLRREIARAVVFSLAATLFLGVVHAADGAAEPYEVGAVLSLSGPGSSLGRPEADSVQLAVDEINKAGGVQGHPLHVTILDDESNPTTAVNDLRKLLDQKVIAILGTPLTQTSLAMIPIVTEAQIPMISFASSAQVVDPASDHKWIFKMPVTDIHMANVMQSYMKKLNQTKVAVIFRNDDYGKTGLSHFADAGKGAGFTVVDSEAIAATATDATTQLTKIKAANPQAVIVWSTLPSVTVIMKAYRELGLTQPIYFSDGAANALFLQQAGDAINGAFIASTKISIVDELAKSDPAYAVTRHYADEYVKAYPKGGPVNQFGGFGYDGVYVLRAALTRAGSSNAAKLRDALEHVTYTGVTGTFRMSPTDHAGTGVDAAVLTKIDAQKFHLVR